MLKTAGNCFKNSSYHLDPPPPKKISLFMISLITFDDFNFKVVSYIFLQVGAIVWIFFFQFCMKSVSYQIKYGGSCVSRRAS